MLPGRETRCTSSRLWQAQTQVVELESGQVVDRRGVAGPPGRRDVG